MIMRTKLPRRTAAPLLALALLPLAAACGTTASPGGPQTSVPDAGGPGGGTTNGSSTVTPTDQGDQPEPQTMPEVRVDDVTLRATMGVGFSQWPDDPGIRRLPSLVVDYTLTNHGKPSLHVFDRIPAGLGSAALPPELNPEHAWVHMEGGVIRVTKQAFSLNPEVMMFAPPAIGVRELHSGGTLEGRAVIPLTPKLDVPDTNFVAPREPVDPTATEWQFCIQVEEATAPASPDPKHQGVLSTPVSAPRSPGLLCTAPAPLVQPGA